ncbi:uncharacterized protein LOC106141973 [Amyelois transitella]|uniref:uncharacterized protein LOC106141973 n=1 Tax=Amyelois transitella TaxID=680683 RepID=UPI00298FC8D0|nr:uncharacterized protein LOC106141973 [Amyelois transitella]
MRWRQYKIAFTADIEKMFRQIWVQPEYQCYQKIMWRDEASDILQEYQLTTVTYGTKAAPFLAMMTLRQLAEDEKQAFPEAANIVKTCFYMDDLLHGAHSIQSAKQIKQDLIKLLKKGGLNLRKWNSNYQELLQENTEFNNQENYIFHQLESSKTLGVHWKPKQDVFIFESKIEPNFEDKIRNTKRKLLYDISRLFDPLGWITPLSTKLKILFQRLWNLDIKWDDEIPRSINSEWLKIQEDMPNINKIKIPRWLGTKAVSDIELHGFCDASQKAYACVIYCKIFKKGEPKISLVAGKSKLVPRNKQTTLPRLELCGAHLLSKLMLKAKECLSDHDMKIYGWVDSTAVLGWLQGNPDRWTTFVANRVRQITNVIPPSSWHYIKSTNNPADCASRGLTVTQLINHPLWWQAPSWLLTYENKTNKSPMLYMTNEEEKQVNKVCHVAKQEKSIEEELLCQFRSFSKVIRVLAWVRRFLRRSHQESYLTLTELREAKIKIIKRIQEIEFSEEITSLKDSQRLTSRSKLLNLTPFLDEQGVLRVGGRLKNARISADMKNPIIIPYASRLTQLIIDDAYKVTLHGGARVTLALIRQKYWLISGNRATKKHIRQCVTCKKHNPRLQEQIMGDLPSPRVNPSRPFQHTGVDYTGHILVKANKGRGIKTSKGYVAVFVCMATKAVHLELVSDLSTSAFIAVLRRMAARWGTPSHLYSDNGTNFVGANRILQEEYQEILQVFNDDFVGSLTGMKITWHFNSPAWPSAGGLFEAAVKSFKFHFKRVVGEQRLTFEEYSTLLTQIEACMNSRPLCALSEDPEDFDYLTPAHFLSGGPTLTLIETERDMRTRWHLTQKIYQDIWKRWRAEYLTQLTSRSKWRYPRKNIQINDVVLIHEVK